MSTNCSLPSLLYIFAARDEAPAFDHSPDVELPHHHLDVLKATRPDGLDVPVAFTRREYAAAFAQRLDIARAKGGVSLLEVPTEDFLDQLLVTGEARLCVDPMQTSERHIESSAETLEHLSAASRDHVSPPLASGAFPREYLNRLVEVARQLPTIETIWLLPRGATLGEHGEASRPLLVVRESGAAAATGDGDCGGKPLAVFPDDQEHPHAAHHHMEDRRDALMELGDRWCETLPPGQAVDMLPWDPVLAEGLLNDVWEVYQRAGEESPLGFSPNL